jgi:4-amino-4-deoxy-L-arabinose transferase-like glycosyltransferase
MRDPRLLNAEPSADTENESRTTWWRSLAFVVVLAFAVRVIHAWLTLSTHSLADLLILDSRVYDETANAMLQNGFMGGDEVFSTAPLYPWVVSWVRAFVAPGQGTLIVVQQAMALASVVLVGVIARMTFGVRAATPAAALFAFYGAGAMLETKLMPSTFGVLCALLSLTGLLDAARRRTFASALWLSFLSGLAVGATCLVRLNTILFVPLAALWLFGFALKSQGGDEPDLKRGAGSVIVFALGVFLVLAPPIVRNSMIEGEFASVTAHGGMTLYQSNNEAATGIYSAIPGVVGNPAKLSAGLRRIAEREAGHSLTMSEVDDLWRARAFEFWLVDPLRAATLIAAKLRFWLGDDEISTEYVLATERSLTPSLWLMPVPFAVILALAVLGIQGAVRRPHISPGVWLLLGFVATNVASTAIFYFSSRYRLPAVPVLCGFAGLGVVQIIDAVSRSNDDATDSSRIFAMLAALGVGLFSLYSFTDDYERYAAKQWFTYGLIHDERQEHDLALASYQHAIVRLGDQWHVHYALGRAYGRQGQATLAIQHYERALKLRPQSRDVRRGLEQERGKVSEQKP